MSNWYLLWRNITQPACHPDIIPNRVFSLFHSGSVRPERQTPVFVQRSAGRIQGREDSVSGIHKTTCDLSNLSVWKWETIIAPENGWLIDVLPFLVGVKWPMFRGELPVGFVGKWDIFSTFRSQHGSFPGLSKRGFLTNWFVRWRRILEVSQKMTGLRFRDFRGYDFFVCVFCFSNLNWSMEQWSLKMLFNLA